MTKIRIATVSLLSILIGYIPWAAAETYKVVTEPLAPVHYEENGVIKGIATEIVEAIFAEAGLETEISVYPWKRAYHITQKEKNTFIYTINRTPKREALFKWIGPILSKETYLYKARERKDIQIKSYEDAKQYITAVILGHSLTTRLMDKGFTSGKELVVTRNKQIQIKVFLKGHSDLITGNQYTIFRSLKSEGYSMDYVEPALFITAGGYYLAANLDTDDTLITRLQEANKRIQASGLVEKTVKKYMQ